MSDETQDQVADVLDIDAIMEMKTVMTRKVSVQLNGGVQQAIIDLKDRIFAARETDKRSNLPDVAPKLKKELDELLEKAQATTVVFEFKSIGRPAYEKLLRANKPTQAQIKEGLQYNPDKFAPALVSAACISPVIPLEKAKEMFSDERWNNAELLRLFLAAQEVNTELPDIPLSSSAIEQTLDSVLRLTSASQTESLTASSSEGLSNPPAGTPSGSNPTES